MRIFPLLSALAILTLFSSCSATESLQDRSHQSGGAEERIILSINEAVEFSFYKKEGNWNGELICYTLNADDEKTVQRRYLSAQDSTWRDFDQLVDFLDLYEINPQNEIEGWIPDSSELPKRVYSFEVYDGSSKRSFSYQDPENELRDYWQSQNILMFVTFVQDELSWVEASS